MALLQASSPPIVPLNTNSRLHGLAQTVECLLIHEAEHKKHHLSSAYHYWYLADVSQEIRSTCFSVDSRVFLGNGLRLDENITHSELGIDGRAGIQSSLIPAICISCHFVLGVEKRIKEGGGHG